MNRCSVKPYEGELKYIFVSYCHKDKQQVFPIIEQLARDGYRVWYDEGIDPGAEWPEIIAAHLNGCFACMAFISENSLNSHNCRREINFALLKKKPFISVILEEVQMSLGMEMQLSATQSIFKFTLPSEYEFFLKLYEAKFLKECLGIPNLDIHVSKQNEYHMSKHADLFAEEDLKRDTFSDKWFLEKHQQKVPKENFYWLLRSKTNEKIVLRKGETKLGRSNTMCDYVITENGTIGRYHARIVNQGTECYLEDNHSKNKTFLGNNELEQGKKYLLHNGDNIYLSNEKFIFYQGK